MRGSKTFFIVSAIIRLNYPFRSANFGMLGRICALSAMIRRNYPFRSAKGGFYGYFGIVNAKYQGISPFRGMEMQLSLWIRAVHGRRDRAPEEYLLTPEPCPGA